MKLSLLTLCFLWATAASAQWSAVLTQNGASQEYQSFGEIKEVENFIKEQAKESRIVTELVYGDYEWFAVATGVKVKTQISWQFATEFPRDWVAKQWDDGKYITKVTYGDGNWAVLMTNNTPYLKQSWAKRDTWDKIIEFVREKWKENNKYNITDIAYGNGVWYVVMSVLKEYEAQSFNASESFPGDWIGEKYKDNYNISSVESDGKKWYVIVTKQTSNLGETIFNPQEDFPKEKIREQWDKNRRISTLVYSDQYADFWDSLYDTPTGSSNKEKAAKSLADKKYTEAIKYYKAAIAEGNTEELTWNNLAWAEYLSGNCTDALEHVNKAINIKSTYYNNHTKASVLKCQNKCSEAIKYYDEAIRLYRKENAKFTTSDYYADRADVKRCLGNYSGAIEDIELALSIEPDNSTLKNKLKELNKLAGNK